MNWPALPFVRLILPLIAGILLGIQPIGVPPSWLIIFLGSLLIFLLYFSSLRIAFRYRRWYGILLFVGLTALGALLVHFHTSWHHPQHLRHFSDGAAFWKVQVQSIRSGDKSIRLQTIAEAFSDTNGSVFPLSGQLLVYLPVDSHSQRIAPGQMLALRANIEPLSPPMNPHAFDFAAYMSKKGIYHRAFPKTLDWKIIEENQPSWTSGLYHLQQYCLSILQKHLNSEETLAIGAALIMGERDLINEEIREAYTDTGAIHVLAVSGLHVGIIYLGLGGLLGLIGLKGKKWRWPRSLVLILCIWGFALFTGGSASVLRAASMFSFLIIGEALYRRHNIYNTLAASAFLLLCIQPLLLLDVGFQLSYLAVIGIVFFQSRIYRVWYIPNRLGNYLWKLASVSIAAQLTTLPVSLFYFHQFPLYFWLSGWVVVPAALLILCLGLGLLLLYPIPWLPGLLGELLSIVIQTMNQLIFHIQQLPLALLSGIWIGTGIVILLYLALLQLMKGLHDRRLRPIQWALIGMITIGGWHNVSIWQAEHQQGITIYHLYGHTVVDVFQGRRLFCLSDLPADHPQLAMAAANNRAYYRIKDSQHFLLPDTSFQTENFVFHNNFFQIGKTTGFLLDTLPKRAPPAPIPVDYLIIRDNPDLNVAQLMDYFKPQLLLFDASNYRGNTEQWVTECKKLGIACHDIGEKGAWTKVNKLP